MLKNNAQAEALRATAYFLWEQDGRPDGRAMEYWLRAKEMHLRQFAYDRWLEEGAPEGRADLHWRSATARLGDG